MVELLIACSLLTLAQQPPAEAETRTPETWARFYEEAAKQYRVSRVDDGAVVSPVDHAVFEWASINEFHGGVFAWTDGGRPAVVATIFSFPRQGANQRLAVHEFVSVAGAAVKVEGPSGVEWTPPNSSNLRRLSDAPPPPGNANLLKLQCRRLAKDFSGNLNRLGERWDLRLLPTPLVEYPKVSEDILGGGLFAFVGYSTDPEILVLLEARDTKDGPLWHFQPIRFSDKSLYLSYKDKPVWESVRARHGANGPDTEDSNYRVLASEPIPSDVPAR